MTYRSLTGFCMSMAACLLVTVNAFSDVSHTARFAAGLLGLIALHLVLRARLSVPREALLYLAFACYNALTMLWAPDRALGWANVQMTVNFFLVIVLFSALVAYYPLRGVVTGLVAGSLLGVITYTRISGFPFVYPEDFSYNSIAGMYLFGLFAVAAFGVYLRQRLVALVIGVVLLGLVMATTSIKTNLGIVLGVGATAMMHFRYSMRAILRNAIPVAAALGVLAYAVASNDALVERLQHGMDRVSVGLAVLTARDAQSGVGIGLNTRENWRDVGIKGWLANPVLGNGVEAFRTDYGVTSHATPIDLAYNTGVIGLALFYSLYASIAWRLLQSSREPGRTGRGLIVAAVTCYAFMSLSETAYYDTLLAAFIGFSAILLAWPAEELPEGIDSAVGVPASS